MNRLGALFANRRSAPAARRPPASRPASRHGGVSAPLSRAASLVGEIVRAADHAAEEIRYEANRRSSGRGSERERLEGDLMLTLAERADALRAEAEQLAGILERSAALLAAAFAAPVEDELSISDPGPPGASARPETGAPAGPEPSAPGPASQGDPGGEAESLLAGLNLELSAFEAALDRLTREGSQEPATPPAADPPPASSPSAGLRMVITQMAVAGASREEIERHLRTEFGIDDPGPVLTEVFGSGRT